MLFRSASSTNGVMTAVEGDVVGDVWGQSGALGQLDWSGQARNDMCQTAGTTTDGWQGVIVKAIAKLNSWDKAKPWSDFDWKIKTNLGVGTADGEVIEISSIEVHRTQCGSDSQTDFVSTADAELGVATEVNAINGTGETIKVFVMIVNQTDHSSASVIGQASREVEFRKINVCAAQISELAILEGVDVLSAKAKGKLLSQRDVKTQTDVDGVVSTIQTALIVAGVISDREACANGVEQCAVFFWKRSDGALAARSGSAGNSVQARASGQNEC